MATDVERTAVGRLAGDALGGGVRLIGGLHRAIADRVFDGIGPAAAPVRSLHDGISSAVYAGVGAVHAAAPRVAATVAVARGHRGGDRAWSDSSKGAAALAAVNGLWGDTMAADYPELALPMTVRRHRRDLHLDRASVESAYPHATGRLAVFVHGLCETDESWGRCDERANPTASFALGLEVDAGCTPVLIRYNSGLHVSDNGRQLASLLEELATAWPVPVEGVILIGHSMGGLVARSACHYGTAEGHQWVVPLTHVISLGTPHLGAPLEKGVHAASWLAWRLPETRSLSKVLEARSAGVKDLRFGACVEDDWSPDGPGEFMRDRSTEVPFVAHAGYYFISASITDDPGRAVGRIVGDLLVRAPSASGRGRQRRIPFEVDKGRHIGGLNHFDLLHHPAVYAQLIDWIGV